MAMKFHPPHAGPGAASLSRYGGVFLTVSPNRPGGWPIEGPAVVPLKVADKDEIVWIGDHADPHGARLRDRVWMRFRDEALSSFEVRTQQDIERTRE
jgi:hypothetical protein